jgi:hypothetical protein
VTPAMTRGLRVSVTVKSGNATATSPSPLAEIPVAHQRRQNGVPRARRGGGASAVEGTSTESPGGLGGSLSGTPPISRAARSTEANEHLPRLPGPTTPRRNRRASGRTEGYQGRAQTRVDAFRWASEFRSIGPGPLLCRFVFQSAPKPRRDIGTPFRHKTTKCWLAIFRFSLTGRLCVQKNHKREDRAAWPAEYHCAWPREELGRAADVA